MAAPAEIRHVPDCRVFVAGQRLAGEKGAALTRVRVDLDADLFGECALTFHDPGLALTNGEDFQAGTAIKVELGFGARQVKVFEGEVVALEPMFWRDRPPSLRVVCHEALHRLALSRMTRAFNEVDDKEIAGKIAREHGLTSEAPAGTKEHALQGNVTDAAFLRRLAQKSGNSLRIEGKKLIIGPPPKLDGIALRPGDGLRKLKVEIKSLQQVGEVTVHGWDPKTRQEFVGKAKPEGETGEGARKYGKGSLAFAGHEHAARDTASAEVMAKGRLRRIAEGFVVARGEMTGNPQVVPGQLLDLDKIGDGVDGKYRVEHAVHDYSRRGYLVQFRAVRVAKKARARARALPPRTAGEVVGGAAEDRGEVVAQQRQKPLPGTFEGIVKGPHGALKNWPFRLLRGGAALGPSDLGQGTTKNRWQGRFWLTDKEGKYRFEKLPRGPLKIDIVRAAATSGPAPLPPIAAVESGVRSVPPKALPTQPDWSTFSREP